MPERRRLLGLAFSTSGQLSATDEGQHVHLWAYDNYGDEPAALNADQAQRVRDWLTTWLDRPVSNRSREDTD